MATPPAPVTPTVAPVPVSTEVSAPPPASSIPDAKPGLNDAFSELDKMFNPDELPVEKKVEEKPRETKPVEGNPTEKPTEKQVEKPAEKKADDQQPPKPEKAKTLREMLEKATSASKDWEAKYNALKSESAKPKDDPEKAQYLKDKEVLTKKLKEVEEKLRYAKFETTDDYAKEYQTPFYEEYENGKAAISSMNIKEPDKKDALGDIVEEGKTRKATSEDWEALMSITDEDSANKFIAEKFGYNTAKVTLLRNDVLKLHRKMEQAKVNYRKTGVERERLMAESTKKNQELVAKSFSESVNTGTEKYPKLFKPIEGDEKGNAMLEEGEKLAKLAFGTLDPSETSSLPKWIQEKLVDGKLPPQEQINLHSAAFNMMKGFNRLSYRNRILEKEDEGLRKDISEYEDSEPKKGEAKRVATEKKEPSSALDMIEKMAQMNG